MIKITIPAIEAEWDELIEEFVTVPGGTYKLEHSLLSISKWESKWHVPFLDAEKTYEQTLHYIWCMCLDEDVPYENFRYIPASEIERVNAYIKDPYSATTFNEDLLKKMGGRSGPINSERVTSELVYYWMYASQIPTTCETWHFNRLMNLLRIFEIKSEKPKKMSKAELARRNRELNAARRKKHHSKG